MANRLKGNTDKIGRRYECVWQCRWRMEEGSMRRGDKWREEHQLQPSSQATNSLLLPTSAAPWKAQMPPWIVGPRKWGDEIHRHWTALTAASLMPRTSPNGTGLIQLLVWKCLYTASTVYIKTATNHGDKNIIQPTLPFLSSPLTSVSRYMARLPLLSFLSTSMAGMEQRTAGTKMTVK